MANPYAIQVHCDGAMDYDSQQTGGNGFVIDFPDSFEAEQISHSIRNDGQGIHRLEMISLIEAMESVIAFLSNNPKLARQAAGVEVYTDRFSVTDGESINPYRIRNWRKSGWKNHEGKAVKNADLLDKIDKTRLKLTKVVGGQVTINFKRRKHNKVADKLAKAGKNTVTRGKKIFTKNDRRVIKRLYDGGEIEYPSLGGGEVMEVRVYAWQPVGKQFEVCFEVCSGDLKGNIIKASVNDSEKSGLHRGHYYLIEVDAVFTHHVRIILHEEIEK